MMKCKILLLFVLFCVSRTSFAQSFYGIKVYHFETKDQENILDNYLKDAFLPAIQRYGVKTAGVFKPIANDTASDKRIIVLMPFKSASQFAGLSDALDRDKVHAVDGKVYLDATYRQAPYKRIENIMIKAFRDMPKMHQPLLTNKLSERVYELRSYEGPTEVAFRRKVEMFNEGGEIKLFSKLSFNAVFYGSVLSGSRMPNLMYLTTFDDMASRDQHWKDFFASAEWKELSAKEYYKNTVSRNETILMRPVEYSGF